MGSGGANRGPGPYPPRVIPVLRAYRLLLRNAPLTQLLVGEFVSSIGDWLYLVAILILVYAVSNDPVILGIVGAARVLPYVFLSIPAGIAADRYDRRLILLVTDIARGTLMLIMAGLAAAGAPIVAIVILAVVATCFSSFFGPAIGSYLPSLVADEEQLGPANSAWSTLDLLAFVIGPAIGGLLIAAGGIPLAFILNAATFAVIAVVLWRLPSPRRSGTGVTGGPAAAGERPGLSAGAAHEPSPGPEHPRPALSRSVVVPVLGLALIDVVGSAAGGGLGVLTVVIAVSTLGSGEAGTGFLNAGIGIGGFAGALMAGVFVLRPSLVGVLAGGSIVLAAGLAGLGFAGSLPIAVGMIAVGAGGAVVVEVTSTTILQRAIPDEIRGRTLGVLATASMLAMATGSFALPILAGAAGIGPLLAGTGVAVTVAGLIGTALAAPAARRVPEGPAAARFASLARLPLFAGVPAPTLEAVATRLAPVASRAGDVVIRQGDPADRFYLIQAGTFEVTRREPGEPLDQAPTHLRTMTSGEVFGEIGLLRATARTATVTALTDGELLALDGASFLELVNAGPGLAPRLLDLRHGAPGAAG
jgi:predicted MFS family arabinose efflux permease